ncbi:MAG: transcriptional repressor [Anaerolineales bacterium]|nr:transcriptional repressor [Anaerolineales bacterium]
MHATEMVLQKLRQRELRVTPPRRVIVERLAADHAHPNADDACRQVTSSMPDVSRTTVYNTLRALVDLGELIPVEDAGPGGTRYDTNPERHHHLLCLRCRRLADIQRHFDGLDLPPRVRAGYRIVSTQVTFYGYCPEHRGL